MLTPLNPDGVRTAVPRVRTRQRVGASSTADESNILAICARRTGVFTSRFFSFCQGLKRQRHIRPCRRNRGEKSQTQWGGTRASTDRRGLIYSGCRL